MLKYADRDVVFQEIPDEVTLALNLSCCPNRCPGCHSPQLWEDIGEPLDETTLRNLLRRYEGLITCVCFMGGDNDPSEVARLARFVRTASGGTMHTGWYSGCAEPPAGFDLAALDYLKTGAWIESLGGLRSPATNQRLYRIREDGTREDITRRFRRK